MIVNENKKGTTNMKMTNYQKVIVTIATEIVTHTFKDSNITCSLDLLNGKVSSSRVCFMRWKKNTINETVFKDIRKSSIGCISDMQSIIHLLKNEDEIFKSKENVS